MSMAEHLFFTGEKGVGKSTLVRAVLAAYRGSLGGFFTVKAGDVLPGETTVHLLRADRREVPCRENLLFCCGRRERSTLERFDRLGCAALAVSGPGLWVMDELGPHEARAAAFCRAVLDVLDGPVPVLGVLQRAEAPLLRQAAAHPRVRVVEVTRENRDGLARTLPADFLKQVDGAPKIW